MESEDAGARLSAAVDRLADRLRVLADVRLGRPASAELRAAAGLEGGQPTVADVGHALAQLLADAAQGVEERRGDVPPTRRRVPRLLDLAVADQVAVTGHDLVAAVAPLRATPAEVVWHHGERLPVAELLTAVTDRLIRVRLLV